MRRKCIGYIPTHNFLEMKPVINQHQYIIVHCVDHNVNYLRQVFFPDVVEEKIVIVYILTNLFAKNSKGIFFGHIGQAVCGHVGY